MGDGADDAYDMALREEWEASNKINQIWKKEVFKQVNKELTGKVINIVKDTIKKGANAGKPYYKVTVEDVEGEHLLFHAWNYGVIEAIKVGENAAISYTETPDGKWRHIANSIQVTDINDGSDSNQKPIERYSPAPETKQAFQKDLKGSGGNNIYINRMSAIKTAVEYAGNGEYSIDDVIAFAERFLTFIETGE